jgi:dolichol-phosphate mannosyltransferase
MLAKKRPPVYLSIVFSFRNEEGVLSELVRRMRAVMKEAIQKGLVKDYQIVFVNDASTDRSLPLLLELAAGHRDIGIVNMSRNFGVAPCVMAGLAYAEGDAVVYMDADLQDPPEVIIQMLDVYGHDPELDVVHTVRTRRAGEPRFKLWVTKIGYFVLNSLSNIKIPSDVGDFKLLSRRAAGHVLQFKESNPFMRGIVAWIGFKQAFIPYDREARFAGKSKFFVLGRSVISHVLNAAIVNFSSVPLQIASFCGLFAILGDVLIIGHALYQKFSGHAVPGWTALMVVVLFIGGVQLFCIGMIGLYLNSVHQQTKMRPNYIVSSTYGLREK